MRNVSIQSLAISVALSLAGLGCGSSRTPEAASGSHTVSGLAAADSPVVSVALKDSGSPPSLLTTTPDASGEFSFDVAALRAPFLLKAEADAGAVYAIAPKGGAADVNGFTTIAVAASSSRDDAESVWSGHDGHSSDRVGRVIKSLGTVLKPLFDLYGITNVGGDGEGSQLRALLHDVSFAARRGVVTVTNRATEALIFTGPLNELASGTFHPENMPAGPGTPPPPPSGCTYTYDAWGACQADGTQTRTVASATPAGCTGTPVLTQPCSTTPPPSGCTYTYGAWGTCQPSNTQTRTVLTSSPAGCTGGSPALSQACLYSPPVDGAALYTQTCASCHGALASSNLKGKGISLGSIQSFGMTKGLTDSQLQAVVTAVGS